MSKENINPRLYNIYVERQIETGAKNLTDTGLIFVGEEKPPVEILPWSIEVINYFFKRDNMLPHYARQEAELKKLIEEHGSKFDLSNLTIQTMTFSPDVIPFFDPDNLLLDQFDKLRKKHPEIYDQILMPLGTAGSSYGSDRLTPIKFLQNLIEESGKNFLPGDPELQGLKDYGEVESRLVAFFQPNGAFFNHGSTFYHHERGFIDFPDQELWRIVNQSDNRDEIKEKYGVDKLSRKLFIGVDQNDRVFVKLFTPNNDDSYETYTKRIKDELKIENARLAFSASPFLVYPGVDGESNYCTLQEIFSQPQNDTRHIIYHPYKNFPVLGYETSRARSIQPEALYRALYEDEPVRLNLKETLGHLLGDVEKLKKILDENSYEGGYQISEKEGDKIISVKLLEGVYSHLCPFVTKNGNWGILRTSGSVGRITGNAGFTLRELSCSIKEINDRLDDPIIALFTGSQGNDVDDVFECFDGEIKKVSEIPELALNPIPTKRGVVTSPRLLAVKKET